MKLTKNKNGLLFSIRRKSDGLFYRQGYQSKGMALVALKSLFQGRKHSKDDIFDFEIVEYAESCTHSILFDLDKLVK